MIYSLTQIHKYKIKDMQHVKFVIKDISLCAFIFTKK
jgi:hypothetical protein